MALNAGVTDTDLGFDQSSNTTSKFYNLWGRGGNVIEKVRKRRENIGGAVSFSSFLGGVYFLFKVLMVVRTEMLYNIGKKCKW